MGRVKLRINITRFLEFAEIARVMKRRGHFQQLLKTQVILILNFTRIHYDYLLITWGAKSLSFWMLKTATIVGRGHRSRTLLNLLATFFHLPTFWERSFTTSCYFSYFHFPSYPLILRYIPRQLSRNETPLLQKNNFTIVEAVARQPEDQSWASNFALFTKQDLKNTLFIDQSAFSNFALYVIRSEIVRVISKSNELQVRLRYIHFQIEFALRAALILKSQVWLVRFSVSLSVGWGKRRDFEQKIVRFGYKSHCWEPIRLQGSPVISKRM